VTDGVLSAQELKRVVQGTALVAVPLAFAVMRFDWGLYHYANRTPLFEGIGVIAAYVPLAIVWLKPLHGHAAASAGAGRCAASGGCALASSLRRYVAPLVGVAAIMVLITACFAAESLARAWWYTSDASGMTRGWGTIVREALRSSVGMLSGLPGMVVLGVAYTALAQILASVFPSARGWNGGVLLLLTAAFLLAHGLIYLRGLLGLFGLEPLVPIALGLVGLDVALHGRALATAGAAA
jgi:hypothetical protein